MPRFFAKTIAIAALLLTGACQLSGPAGVGGSDTTMTAIAGDPIEVTALDAPAIASPEPAAAAEAPPATGPTKAATPEATPPSATGLQAEASPDAAPEAAEPAPVKSDRQIACEKKKGQWVNAGGGLQTCIFRTKDAGKRCDRESQCDGACLARSGTCSPLKPLLGCNEILQDNGARVTLCIE
jgi:hypothetical protein